MDRLVEHRRQFPALDGKTYLNFGVVGPLSLAAQEALAAHAAHKQREGPASPPLFVAQLQEEDRTRAALARLLDVSADSVALIDATVTGCAAVLLAIAWERGDRLVLGDAEYPALVLLARQLARRFGVELDTVPLLRAAQEAPARIAAALTPRTRAVLVSHVLWTSGEVLDLRAISAAVAGRALLVVDGAQGPGNVVARPAHDGADVYAFACHKALCGPEGIGGLYVAPAALEKLEPLQFGWRGVRVDAAGAPVGFAPGARRFEGSTTAFATRPALRAALEVADSFAPLEERCARVQKLAAHAFAALQHAGMELLLPGAPAGSIVTFRVPGRPCAQVAEALLRERIFTRHLPQTDVVRFSLSYLNTEAEIEQAVQVLRGLR